MTLYLVFIIVILTLGLLGWLIDWRWLLAMIAVLTVIPIVEDSILIARCDPSFRGWPEGLMALATVLITVLLTAYYLALVHLGVVRPLPPLTKLENHLPPLSKAGGLSLVGFMGVFWFLAPPLAVNFASMAFTIRRLRMKGVIRGGLKLAGYIVCLVLTIFMFFAFAVVLHIREYWPYRPLLFYFFPALIALEIFIGRLLGGLCR